MAFVIPKFRSHLSGFFLLTVLVLLAACASPKPPQVPTAPAPVLPSAATTPELEKPEPKPTPTPTPRPRPRPTPTATPMATPAPQASPAATPDSPTDAESERAKSLAGLVQNGHFVRSEGNALIFAKTEASDTAPSGLFEDAIILGRLRSRLNQIPGLPAGISESATVKDATADLTASADLSVAISASMIDAALKTEGVALVRVRF